MALVQRALLAQGGAVVAATVELETQRQVLLPQILDRVVVVDQGQAVFRARVAPAL